jgi:hypothetical protein
MEQASPRIMMHSISRKGLNFMHASRGNLQMINSIGQIRTGYNPPQERRERGASVQKMGVDGWSFTAQRPV